MSESTPDGAAQDLLAAVTKERDELQKIFALQRLAEMRAIKRWQDATGKDMDWPDHSRLVEWLIEQCEKLKDHNAVHISMLSGAIARPSLDQILHIYQDDLRDYIKLAVQEVLDIIAAEKAKPDPKAA
jgi:hypothetical protein